MMTVVTFVMVTSVLRLGFVSGLSARGSRPVGGALMLGELFGPLLELLVLHSPANMRQLLASVPVSRRFLLLLAILIPIAQEELLQAMFVRLLPSLEIPQANAPFVLVVLQFSVNAMELLVVPAVSRSIAFALVLESRNANRLLVSAVFLSSPIVMTSVEAFLVVQAPPNEMLLFGQAMPVMRVLVLPLEMSMRVIVLRALNEMLCALFGMILWIMHLRLLGPLQARLNENSFPVLPSATVIRWLLLSSLKANLLL